MIFSTLAGLLIKIVFMIGIGVYLRKKLVIDNRVQKGFTDLLMDIALPCSLINAGNSTFSTEVVESLKVSAAVALVYYVATLVLSTLLSRVLPLEKKEKRVFVTMITFANVAFVGFPITQELWGSGGLLCAIMFDLFYNIFFFTYGVFLLSNQPKFEVISIIKNKFTICSLFAIVLFLSPFRMPSQISDALGAMANLCVPLSMILIGVNLADMNMMDVLKDRYSYIVSVLRLVVLPAIVFVICRPILHLDDLATVVCVIMAACPAGSMNVILAEKHNCAPEFATRAVVQSMLFMLVTLPVTILFL